MTRLPSLRRIWKGLRNQRGAALIEFALSAPFLILLYLGGYQLSDALACRRKVTIADRAVADLVTQDVQENGTTLDQYIAAAAKIMTPYDASNAKMVVTQLHIIAPGVTVVDWSHPSNGATMRSGSYQLPTSIAGVDATDTYLIMSEVTYSYKPAVSFGIVGPLTFSDVIYMSPRKSNSVTWQQ